jgi:hypothetical protein
MRILTLLLLLGCPSKKTECDEDNPCAFGSVCVEGVCEAQSCATSSQCGIEQYCKDHSCVDGCQTDDDCKFGDLCDAAAGECVSATCTDTHLDCGFGEFCSPAGECYDANGYYCAPCSDDGDCGGSESGNYCLSGYCGVECVDDHDCPGGYDCLPVQDYNGNVIAHNCYTRCYLYDEG